MPLFDLFEMGKKGKGKGRRKGTQPAVEEDDDGRKGASMKAWYTIDDIEMDSEDEFHSHREKIMLDDEVDGAEDDAFADEEVFGVDQFDSDEEIDEEDERVLARARQVLLRNEKTSDDEDEVAERKQSEKDLSWGLKREQYYDADDVELEEEDAKLEEEEALRLQKERLEKMAEADFLGDDFDDNAESQEQAEEDHAFERIDAEERKKALSKLGEEALLTMAYEKMPVLVKILEELEDKAKLWSEIKASTAKTKSPENSDIGYHLFATYFTNAMFYLSYCSEQGGISQKEHPAVKVLDQVSHYIDVWIANRDILESQKKTESRSTQPKSTSKKLREEPPKAKTSGQEKERPRRSKRQPAEQNTTSIEEPELPALKFSKVKSMKSEEKKKAAQLLQEQRKFEDDELEYDGFLNEVDYEDKMENLQGSKFRVSTTKKSTKKDSGLHGDSDLPYRDRYGNVVNPKEEEEEELPEGYDVFDEDGDEDVFDDDDPTFEGQDLNDDGDLQGDDEEFDAEGEALYEELAAAGRKRKRHMPIDDSMPVREGGIDDYTPGDKRASTWEMLTNKGLTPKRKKENRNPRVKKRLKFEAAKKKLKSIRAVPVDRAKTGPYRGELTGIKTNGTQKDDHTAVMENVEQRAPAKKLSLDLRRRKLTDILPELNTNRKTEDGDSPTEAIANDGSAAGLLKELLLELSPSASSPVVIHRERHARKERRQSKMFQNFSSDTGETILSDYAVGDTIGEGCFSKVKQARHLPTNSLVAMKCIDKQAVAKVIGTAERILREILVLSHLDHPNITRLLEVIDTPDYIYLALEYEKGGELFDFILSQERIPEEKARAFFRQIVSAVQYCHSHVLLDANETAKLIDFGFANVMRSEKSLETFCGSAAYAAPEMIAKKQYKGNEADIWSLGVILYAIISGKLPFDDSNPRKMYTAILLGKYVFTEAFSEGKTERKL
ncbi:Serine/threonine-protein kinase par-1 [Phlyctochytrium bullatum]|nr:Serine/threonine-protein kinase par-1 [Phlyctochytrium bullatum]